MLKISLIFKSSTVLELPEFCTSHGSLHSRFTHTIHFKKKASWEKWGLYTCWRKQ